MSVEATLGALNSTQNDSSQALFTDANSQLGKDDFLNLLTAQLAHQDPMDPVSNEDFIAQMATFSSLEQMTNLNSSFSKFLQGQALAQYAPIIGKEVVAYDPAAEADVTGSVESISFSDGTPYMNVNGSKIDINNLKEIKASNHNE